MASRRVHLDFPKTLVTEPLIYQIGHEFEVVTNIRRANVDHESGWVDLGLDGEEKEIVKALDYLKEKGVGVSPIERDVVQ